MRRPVLFIAFLLCFGMMFGGAEHAASREPVDQTDLQRFYREINQESFEGKLPDVPVRWGDLSKAGAYGVTHLDKGVPLSIEVDRQSVKSESFAMDVLRHESCHVATIREVKRLHEDEHGAMFAECMSKVQRTERAD